MAAKNYTFKEACAIIKEGKDLEAIMDIGRRYPVLLHKVAVVATKAGDEFIDLMNFMPDFLTANKVNTAIKSGITESGNEDDGEESTEAEVNGEEPTEGFTGPVKWDESMSAKQLWEILGKAGKRKVAKSYKKTDLVEACKKVFGDPVAESEGDEEEAPVEEAPNDGNPYEGKSAMELFKECKKRGVKAEPKKPAKYYVGLLTKDDESKKEETNDDADDWGDDGEEEAPAPKEKAKKAPKETKKKNDADEDDDWDI